MGIAAFSHEFDACALSAAIEFGIKDLISRNEIELAAL
jgi:hypothetical protein